MLFPAEWPYICELCAEDHWSPCMVEALGDAVSGGHLVVCGTCKGLIHAVANENDPAVVKQLTRLLKDRIRRAEG